MVYGIGERLSFFHLFLCSMWFQIFKQAQAAIKLRKLSLHSPRVHLGDVQKVSEDSNVETVTLTFQILV